MAKNSKSKEISDLLSKVLSKDNMILAYKKVKSNNGAAGVDKMTVDQAGPWLRKNYEELCHKIMEGQYQPFPVKRVAIPKDNGGTRNLGIPTVTDRVIQQAIAQVLVPIYEPLFSDNSYAYRQKRSTKDAILKVKSYVEKRYKYAACLDLSKYFDTLNHKKLLKILCREIKDKTLLDLIEKYLKSGFIDNGFIEKTEEGSPQGGNLSPLLANIYLNEFDSILDKKGKKFVRYADDIVLLTRHRWTANRLLKKSKKFLEKKLKLKVNAEKSKVVRVCSEDFKFLGFTLEKSGKTISVKAHNKSGPKATNKRLTNRSQLTKIDIVTDAKKHSNLNVEN